MTEKSFEVEAIRDHRTGTFFDRPSPLFHLTLAPKSRAKNPRLLVLCDQKKKK